MKTTLTLCLLFALAGSSSFGQCYNDDLRGSYGYLAALAVNPQTSTGSTVQTFSSSPTGNLLKAIAAKNGGASLGAVYFDGAGNIYAQPTATTLPQFATDTSIGTYAVATECTVTVTLTDAFTATSSTTSPSTVSLVGLVIKGGDEVYLTQPVATPTAGSPSLSQRTTVRLVRFNNAFTSGCTVVTLTGQYTLVGEGFSNVAPTPTTGGTTLPATPSFTTFVGRMNFNGAGNLTAAAGTEGSTLAPFQYIGVYTVNADCTGTMTVSLVPPTNPAPSTPPVQTSLRFLITPAQGYVDPRGVSVKAADGKPGLIFAIATDTQTIIGTGSAQ